MLQIKVLVVEIFPVDTDRSTTIAIFDISA